jgi:hypothetical protein
MGRVHFARLGITPHHFDPRREDATQDMAAKSRGRFRVARWARRLPPKFRRNSCLAVAAANVVVPPRWRERPGVLNAHLSGDAIAGQMGKASKAKRPGWPLHRNGSFRPNGSAQAGNGDQMRTRLAPGQVLIGVDEDTACIWAAGTWTAMGRGRQVLATASRRSIATDASRHSPPTLAR